MHGYPDILLLDIAGTPQDWVTPQVAAGHLCSDNVAWSAGPTAVTLHGGHSRLTGNQTLLDVPAIIATRGRPSFDIAAAVPSLSSNLQVFTRDRFMCAYCGEVFSRALLTREHIHPVSRGGQDVWANVVTACRACNHRKGNRTCEEAGMSLLYVPYAPNLFEDFILRRGGRRVLADQMEFLLARVPPESRLRIAA